MRTKLNEFRAGMLLRKMVELWTTSCAFLFSSWQIDVYCLTRKPLKQSGKRGMKDRWIAVWGERALLAGANRVQKRTNELSRKLSSIQLDNPHAAASCRVPHGSTCSRVIDCDYYTPVTVVGFIFLRWFSKLLSINEEIFEKKKKKNQMSKN